MTRVVVTLWWRFPRMIAVPGDVPAMTATISGIIAAGGAAGVKRFQNEWVFEPFAEHPSFYSKRMFGGLAAFVFERQVMVLAEPTKTGRWDWHGVLICTGHEHHASLRAEFPALQPHDVLKKWLFISSAHEEFESTMSAVGIFVARNDRRFGIVPKRGSRAVRPVNQS